MHLAVLAKDMSGGGAARAMVKLANGLSADHRVELVLVKATGPYLAEVSTHVTVVDLKARRTMAALPAMSRYLRNRRPDAVISALRHVNILAILSRLLSITSPCLVVSERNMIAVSLRNSPRKRDRLFGLLIPLLYRLADVVVAISSDIQRELTGRYRIPAHKVELIYNPIVTPRLMELASEPIVEPWFDLQTPTVIAAGRLTEHKNYSLLIEAFADASPEGDAQLVIMGEGPEAANLRELARELGVADSVRLPGFVPNVYKFMAKSSLFAHPSRWEGLPGVLIEAMACGLPVVAADSPGGSAEVLGYGRHGRLVPPDDRLAMARAISDGLDGLIPAAGRAGWGRFEQKTVVEQYDVMFRRCVAGPEPSPSGRPAAANPTKDSPRRNR